MYDVGEAPDSGAPVPRPAIRFLVMEYLEGQTLAERLLGGALSITETLGYAIELADALAHAHRRGIVHRDVKPGNVMLTAAGAKLLDFGLSKESTDSGLMAWSTVACGEQPLTAAGAVLGTYPYIAPEQLAGGEADMRSDIFSLGATIFEMATGRRAFQGTTAAAVIGAVLHAEPPTASSFEPHVPPRLDRIVARCLAKEPDDRWQTARDLTLELKAIVGGDSARQDLSGVRRIRRTLFAAGGLLALAIGAAIVLSVRRVPIDTTVARLTFTTPRELKRTEVRFGGPVTVSPDGRHLVYAAAAADGRQRGGIGRRETPRQRVIYGRCVRSAWTSGVLHRRIDGRDGAVAAVRCGSPAADRRAGANGRTGCVLSAFRARRHVGVGERHVAIWEPV